MGKKRRGRFWGTTRLKLERDDLFGEGKSHLLLLSSTPPPTPQSSPPPSILSSHSLSLAALAYQTRACRAGTPRNTKHILQANGMRSLSVRNDGEERGSGGNGGRRESSSERRRRREGEERMMPVAGDLCLGRIGWLHPESEQSRAEEERRNRPPRRKNISTSHHPRGGANECVECVKSKSNRKLEGSAD